jgi:hypothetical protein
LSIVAGRVSSLLTLVVVLALMYMGMQRAKVKMPDVRRIAGLEAIPEAVGRATEMGKPVFATPGWYDVSGADAGQTLAALDVINHVAELCAKFDTRLIIGVAIPNVYPLVVQGVQQAYMAQGKADKFSADMIQFTSSQQYAYMAACLGMMQREKAAACVFVGGFGSEAINFAESAVSVGSISIAGTTNQSQLPFFTAACDYTMLGEELLVAGAYLSKDPQRMGSIVGQDLMKAIALIVIAIGVIMKTSGSNAVIDLLKM